MIDYYKIWESINTESESKHVQLQVIRRIPSPGSFPVFLATDSKNGIRLLYIKIDDEDNIIIENLPKFRGLEISLVVDSLGVFSNKKFIKFSQSIPNTENIFESVISDICERVIRVQNKGNLSTVLIKVLNEWKIFLKNKRMKYSQLSIRKVFSGN